LGSKKEVEAVGRVVARSRILPATVPRHRRCIGRHDHRRGLHGTGTTGNDDDHGYDNPVETGIPAGIKDRRSVLHLEGD